MKKVVIITGASRGIGAQTALLAAANGYAVCVNYLSRSEEAAQVVDSIVANGGVAVAMQADIASEEQVKSLFLRCDKEIGPLTALVNNAGVLYKQSRLQDFSMERVQKVLQTNVVGSFLCCREAILRMSTEFGGSGGSIVNLSSRAAQLGSPNEYIDYAASKGAVDSMTIGLAKELAANKIRVNAVRPGLIYTDIHADGGEPGRVTRLQNRIPMQRGGYPEEVAEAIVWLMSEKASFTTGSFIDVAGGL